MRVDKKILIIAFLIGLATVLGLGFYISSIQSVQKRQVEYSNVVVALFLTDGEPDPDKEKKNDLVFMNSYMDLLWKEVSNLALNKYEVFSVGFSKEVNKGILERISNETKGSVKISDKSNELALSFFDILGNLKNRKSLMDETVELKDKAGIEFDLDEYTSQATMVFTNLDSTSFDVNISAPANLDTNKVVKVNKFDNYNLILNYENNGSEIIPILDNGLTETGDIKENDGIWSGKVLFNKEDSGSASVMVKGIYKGEPFVLEKYLGDFKVYPVGNLIVKPLKNNLYTTLNNQLKIPLEIENNSNFPETIILTLDEDIGKIAQDRIKIEPLSKASKYIYVNLDNNLKKNIYNMKINIEAEDKQIKVEPRQFEEEIEIVSKTGYILRYINEHKDFIIGFIGVIVGLFILIVSIGLLLYRFLVYKSRMIEGKLIYWKESDNDLKDKQELKFNQFKKSRLLITFNEENETAEYKIFNNKYNYDIELTAVASKSKWKFIDGYKALFNKNTVSELLLKTTKPGILIYEGNIYTSKKIYNKDKFITGEYVFQYFVDRTNKSLYKDKGKNILEE